MSNNSDLKVALDLDSTLAATSITAFDLIGVNHTYNDIESWEWGIETFGASRFLNALWNSWTIRPLEVPTMETTVDTFTEELSEMVDTVDIVTHHPEGVMGIEDGKRKWLDKHDVTFDSFVSVHDSKADLSYDVFIDDKPSLTESPALRDDQYVIQYGHRYNEHTKDIAFAWKNTYDGVLSSVDVITSGL